MEYISLFIILGACLTLTVAQHEKFTLTNNEHINADEMLTISNINRIQCVRACKKAEFCFAINVEMRHDGNNEIVCKLQDRVPNPVPYHTGNVGSGFIRKYKRVI